MSTTGEQPAYVPPISERTAFAWPVVAAFIAAALAIGAAHYRLESTAARLDRFIDEVASDRKDATQERQRASDTGHATDLRLQRVEDALPRIATAVEEINRKLEGRAR